MTFPFIIDGIDKSIIVWPAIKSTVFSLIGSGGCLKYLSSSERVRKTFFEDSDNVEQNIPEVNDNITIVNEELDTSLSSLNISSDILDSLSLPQKHKLLRLSNKMQSTDLIASYGNEIKLIDAERWNRIIEQGKSEEFKVIYKKTEF